MTTTQYVPNEYAHIVDNVMVSEKLDAGRKEHGTDFGGHVFTIHERRDTGEVRLLDDDHNHIVHVGRRWLVQRATGLPINNPTGIADQSSWFISWFSCGSGGAAAATPFTPIAPVDADADLAAIRKLQGASNPNNYIYASSGDKKSIATSAVTNIYNPTGSITGITTGIYALFTLVVDFEEYTATGMTPIALINELALYTSTSRTTAATTWNLFSRYTRPSLPKTENDKYTFLWYIYF